MGAVLLVIITIVVGGLTYIWYKSRETKRKLSWLPAVPGLPILGNVLSFGDTSDLLDILEKYSAQYGKIFLMDIATIPTIMNANYDFTEFILSSKTILSKSHDYDYFKDWLSTGLLTSTGAKWKKRRKLITPAFHFSILEQFMESFESNGEVLLEIMRKRIGEDIDIYQCLSLFTLDVICETAMGVSVNAQSEKDSKYVHAVKESCRIVMEKSFSLIKRIPFLYWFTKDYKIEKDSLKHLHSVTYSVIDSRWEKLKNSPKDQKVTLDDSTGIKKKMAFLDILLQSTVDGEPLTRDDIREEVDTFMFEGHDTTTSAMTFILYLLGEHQNIQELVLQEQKVIFGDDKSRRVTYQDVQEMKYLESVIKESLRLYPSVALIGRYVDEDVYYKGNLLPKGVNITFLISQILKDPDNFPDPEKFDPNRFLEGTGNKRPYAYIPFSAGSRNCIGQRFALLEMKTTLSKILRHFQVLPCPDHKMKLVFEVVLKSRNGVKVRLVDRKW